MLLGGSTFFNPFFSPNNLHTHCMISVQSSYWACSAQPAMAVYKTQAGRWQRAHSWDIWFTDSNHNIIHIYWSEKLINCSNITMELETNMICAACFSSLWEITFSCEMWWSKQSVNCKKTGGCNWWFRHNSFTEKFLWFIHAELKKQKLGRKIITGVESCSKKSDITRYWHHILVHDSRSWMLALIIAVSAHTQQQITICIMRLVLTLKLSPRFGYISTCKAGVSC